MIPAFLERPGLRRPRCYSFGPSEVTTDGAGHIIKVPLHRMPCLGSPEHHFWEIIGLMVLSSAALFVWFRKSGWW